MAKSNYSFEKRQREVAKKKKKEEKRRRRELHHGPTPSGEPTTENSNPTKPD